LVASRELSTCRRAMVDWGHRWWKCRTFSASLWSLPEGAECIDSVHSLVYAVQSAQKRILSRTRKITPRVTNIPPSSHIPPPPIAHTVPHLSRKDPDLPWVKFLALFRTEPEVGGLFHRFHIIWRWFHGGIAVFLLDGGTAGMAGSVIRSLPLRNSLGKAPADAP